MFQSCRSTHREPRMTLFVLSRQPPLLPAIAILGGGPGGRGVDLPHSLLLLCDRSCPNWQQDSAQLIMRLHQKEK
jgi:hypothetical protein